MSILITGVSSYSAEVLVEVGESDAFATGNEADLNSVINGNLEAAQGGPSEQLTHEEASDEHPVKRRQSLIWRHFELLDGSSAARCRICLQKLRCFESCTTSNLHRHMSTRHPQLFKKKLTVRQTAPSSHSSQGSIVNFNTETPADTVEAREKRPVPGSILCYDSVLLKNRRQILKVVLMQIWIDLMLAFSAVFTAYKQFSLIQRLLS